MNALRHAIAVKTHANNLSRAGTLMTWTRAVATASILAAVVARAATPGEEALLKVALDPTAGRMERTHAFDALRAIAREESIPVLAALLQDKAWSYPARMAIEAIPGARAEQALLSALQAARDDEIRGGLINSLGHRALAAAVPVIEPHASSPNPTLAAAALNALGSIKGSAAAAALSRFTPPEHLKEIWGDACVRVAEAEPRAAASGSRKLLELVLARGAAPQQAAAMLELARIATDPAAVVIDALRTGDAATRFAALAAVRQFDLGPGLGANLPTAMASLSPEVQAQVLSVLRDRGDRTYAEMARTALAASDAGLRAAGAQLLSVVGESRDAAALGRLMLGENEPAHSARLALARIPGEETTALLLEAFRAGGDRREAALQVLVARGHRALVPDLLAVEAFADPTFARKAAEAVAVLGTPADLGRALETYRQLGPAERKVLEIPIRRLAAKHSLPDAPAAAVVAAAKELPENQRGALVLTLAAIGGNVAYHAVLDFAKAPATPLRQVAVRAFGTWSDLRPISVLFAIAREDTDAEVRAMAVQSAKALHLKNLFGGTTTPIPARLPATLDGLRATWQLAERPAEKDGIIASLRGLKNAKATALADELERDQGKAP